MTTELDKKEMLSLQGLLRQDAIKARFTEVLGPRRGAQFISSIISVTGGNSALAEVAKKNPNSIIRAAAQAAVLDLSIVPTIGHAAIVPYKDEAQFQIMKGGIIQLAHRSSKYKRLHLAAVYEGQLVKRNRLTGEIVLDETKKKSDKIEGWFFFFELVNGYKQEAYWTTTECVEHAWKYSKSFRRGKGLWAEDPLMPMKDGAPLIKEFKGLCTDGSGLSAMCAKTIIKNTISKWGPLSADMLDAFTADQSVIREGGKKEYVDTTAEETQDKGSPPTVQPTDAKPPEAKPTEPAKEPEKPETKASEKPADLKKGPSIRSVEIKVQSTAKTRDPEDVESWVIREDGGPGKFYAHGENFVKMANKAAKEGKVLSLTCDVSKGFFVVVEAGITA